MFFLGVVIIFSEVEKMEGGSWICSGRCAKKHEGRAINRVGVEVKDGDLLDGKVKQIG
jgi:hypothetical protein